MTLSLYSTIRAWKRENARELAQRQETPPRPHEAMRQEASALYAAIAAMGCGLGGMACADTMEAHKP
ncbi:MAG: hypothetical protein H6935_05175 [Thiobacillus sp.]|nr:hypothetical protein [Thiobacillus sp.]